MKKILTIISLVAVTTLLHAQGYIEFYGAAANIQTNTATSTFFNGTGTGGTVGKLAASTTTLVYDFVLLYESTSLSGNSAPTNSAWTPVLANGGGSLPYSTNGAAPGAIYGAGLSAGQQVNLPSTSSYSFELVGFSANLTWSDVLAGITAGTFTKAGFLGWTTVGTVTPFATPGAGDPTLFGVGSLWANGTMQLDAVPTPEPSTMALAGLGGLTLLMFRRRK